MVGGIILILILYVVTQMLLGRLKNKHPFLNKKLLNQLYWYHTFFAAVYYIYGQSNRSDSHAYYERIQFAYSHWGKAFGTSTTFIDFLGYPFEHFFGFNYEMLMVLFAWSGYLGFVYAYIFFKENIPINIKIFKKYDFLTVILFLPNMHFWTASLGKGAPIFFGLMIFTYAIYKFQVRVPQLLIGIFFIYFIRPHVMLFVAVGVVLGYMSGREKIALWKKLLIFVVMIGGVYLVQDKILAVANLENSQNLISDFEQFSQDRSASLSTSGSGVDMQAYPLPFQLFTFWFRPLFVDAPNALGLVVSAENLIYLLLFFKILKKDFIGFLRKSPLMVKMSATIFLLTSLAMTFVMSNLGIIMREKSMVMYYMFFVIYYYLAQKKWIRYKQLKKQHQAQHQQKTSMSAS